ncbi:protein of unknown function [Serratia sp. Tan611]|nr:protein of unknown function [Serratia sp. Tan611]
MPLFAKDALRMELHPFQRQRAVANPHNLIAYAVTLAPGGNLKTVRQRCCVQHQRMVARYRQRIIQPAKDAAVRMANRRGFTVHHFARAHHIGAECLPQCLMPQTDTENRQLTGKMRNGRQRNTGLVRRAGAGGDHQMLRRQPVNIGQLQFIIALYQHLGAKLAKVLIKVVGKRVVVIDQQQHGGSTAYDLGSNFLVQQDGNRLSPGAYRSKPPG